ncbi:MAG: TatD family hydrolase, partial [Candidatus Pacearchaeota archaeon]
MIDSHLHLEAFEEPEEIIKESLNYMTALITSVADPKDAKLVLDLREKYKNFVFACLGFHPECIRSYSDREILDYINFIKNVKNKICGIGEVGLD